MSGRFSIDNHHHLRSSGNQSSINVYVSCHLIADNMEENKMAFHPVEDGKQQQKNQQKKY